jgi:hypothetical protein
MHFIHAFPKEHETGKKQSERTRDAPSPKHRQPDRPDRIERPERQERQNDPDRQDDRRKEHHD